MSTGAGLFARLMQGRSLRPEKRATTLVSMANSLSTIAAALKIIVSKEYGRDLDAPPLTRADLTREVYDPVYPDNEAEAVREEAGRLEQAELEMRAESGTGGIAAAREARQRELGTLSLSFGRGRGEGEAGELTPEEREFLAEIDADG